MANNTIFKIKLLKLMILTCMDQCTLEKLFLQIDFL